MTTKATSAVIVNLSSSAPHICPAAAWDAAASSCDEAWSRDGHSRLVGLALHRAPDLEVGVRRWEPGASSETAFLIDQFCYFQRGRGFFRSATGEVIEARPGTAVHFKQGWLGELEVLERLDATYMRCEGGPAPHTPVLRDAATAGPLKDWGPVAHPILGASRTAGILLSREPDRRAESGIWTCTPGVWRCELASDEYCHFLQGSSTYTHDCGEVIEIKPDTLAYFPRGWTGRCEVHETVRKVYMIR